MGIPLYTSTVLLHPEVLWSKERDANSVTFCIIYADHRISSINPYHIFYFFLSLCCILNWGSLELDVAALCCMPLVLQLEGVLDPRQSIGSPGPESTKVHTLSFCHSNSAFSYSSLASGHQFLTHMLGYSQPSCVLSFPCCHSSAKCCDFLQATKIRSLHVFV